MLSILFINRVYPPDDGATGQLLAELAGSLVQAGWQVTILASGNSQPFLPAPVVGRATPCAPSPVQSSEFEVQSSKFHFGSSAPAAAPPSPPRPGTSGTWEAAEGIRAVEGPSRAERAGASESLGQHEVSIPSVQSSGFKLQSSKFEAGSPFAQPSTFNLQPAVIRVRGLPFTRASLWKRALSYASLYPALLWRALRLPRPDVIVTLTDPPLLLTLGPWLKFWKRARLVHWAQDVYPEVAEELGVLRKNGWGARVLRWFSTASLRRHDQIIAVGRCMKDRLIARGLDASKIAVIPNWAVGAPAPSSDATLSASNRERSDATLAHLMGEGQGVRVPGEVSSSVLRPPSSAPVEPSPVQSSEFKVQGSKFESDSSAPPAEPPSPPRPGRGNEGEVSIPSVQSSEFKSDCSPPPLTVMYSGNFGLAHPFEAILEAVKILDDASSRGAFHLAPVHFVFAGAGPKLSFVREQLAGCRHVEFREPAALENLPAALASADVHLACMSEALLGLVVPSKIYGALAAGRPCLFLGPRDSEAARIILESGRGLVFDPHTGGADLAAVLKRWAARDGEFTACQAACAADASHASGVPLSDFLCVLHRPTTAG